MRALVTGAAGFIGGTLVRQLLARGDQVTAVVRDAARAGALREASCEVVAVDLAGAGPGTEEDLRHAMEGADAVFHLAGSYRIGLARGERPAMYAANVTATERVLDAADAAGVPCWGDDAKARRELGYASRDLDAGLRTLLPA